MLSFARDIDPAVDKAEYKRLIDREKTIMAMHPLKLVMAHDFYEAVRGVDKNGVSVPHRVFSHIFGEHAQLIKGNLQSLVRRKKVRSALISYDEFQGNIKRYVDRAAAEYIDERIALAKQKGGVAEMFDGYSHPDFAPITPEDFSMEGRQKRIREFAEMFNMQAYRLRDLVKAMDTTNYIVTTIGGRINRYENISLRQGEGDDALQFWRRVNALDDYSHVLEDTPNHGGRKDRRPYFIAVGGLVGAPISGMA
ncbi:MAG TPA: hypothetical protein PLF01_02165 [Alphaproteobacteria bacterium]|nr:hypothetical protein [Alphaproteobacteria bacterium]